MEFVPQSWRRETALNDGRVVVLPPIKEKELVEPVSQWGEPGTGAPLGYGGGNQAQGAGSAQGGRAPEEVWGTLRYPRRRGSGLASLHAARAKASPAEKHHFPEAERVMRPGAWGATRGLSQPLGSAPRSADGWQA